MFCGIDTSALAFVKSVPALISAAELLNQVAPVISGAFLQYAVTLCDAYFVEHSISFNQIEYLKLKQLVSYYQIASSEDLDRFADSLLAKLSTCKAPEELERLAYLCYISKSIYGPITPQTEAQIKNLESQIAKVDTEQPQSLDNTHIVELCELARQEFIHGDLGKSYHAIVAALAELEST